MTKNGISRRSFTIGGMALVSSLMLPPIQGVQDAFSVVPLGATRAWAAEPDDSDSTEILVVGRTQLGIVAYDVTNPNSLIPLPGCTVTITSLFNGEVLEGTSDNEGRIVFDVADLAEDTTADIIGFNGSIQVVCEGYRDVFIPLTRITAHSALVAPTRPLDGKPYLRSATVNNWDVQYTQAEFMTAPSSTDNQDVEIEIWMPREKMTPTAPLVKVENGAEVTLGTFVFDAASGSLVKGRVSGPYFLTGSNVFVGENAQLKVDFVFERANTLWRGDLALYTKPSPVDGNDSGSTIIYPSAKYSAQGNLIDLPESMCQPFKGVTLSTWKPEFPVFFDINVFGYAVFGGGTTSVKVHDNEGSVLDKSHWIKQPSQSIKQQAIQEWNRESSEMKAAWNQGVDPQNKLRPFTYAPIRKFTCKGVVQAYVKEEYLHDEKIWQCDLAALASIRYDFTWMYRFTIMGVPGFFHFNPFFQGQASFDLSSKNDDPFSFDFHANSGMELSIDVTFGISMTLGVGVSGIASMSGTGTGYVCTALNFAPNPGHQWPRVTAGWGASFVAMIQAPFSKCAVKIYGEDKPQAYDSNDSTVMDKNSAEWTYGNVSNDKLDQVLQKRLGRFINVNNPKGGTGEFPTFAQLKEMIAIVTNAELLSNKEFERTSNFSSETRPVVFHREQQDSVADVWDEDGVTHIEVVSVADTSSTITDAQVTANEQTAVNDAQGIPAEALEMLLEHEPASSDYIAQYRYVGTMASGNPTRELGVSGISDGSRGGVRPNIERVAFSKVYSDTHMHLLTTKGWGGTYLFRIAAVDCGGGQARSRLVYHQLQSNGNWSKPYAVEFDPQIEGVARDDLYDYDFAVTQANANNGANYIFLLVTSGTRPDGDDTDFVRNIQAHHASLVCLYESGSSSPLSVNPAMTASLPSISEGYTLTNPCITGFSDAFSVAGTNDFCVMGTYARRSIDDTEGVSSSSKVMSLFARFELDATYTKKVFKITTSVVHVNGENALNDTLMLPVKIDDEEYQWSYGSVANCRRANLVYSGEELSGMGKFEALYENNDTTKFKNFVATNLVNIDSDVMRVNRFYAWGNDGEALATCAIQNDDGAPASGIFHVAFDPKNAGEATFTQIGPRSGAVGDFVVDGGGHFLFYAENLDGTYGQTYDEAGDVVPGGEVVEHRHYIKAVAQVDGLFTPPFVFCEVDHIIDGLVACSVNGSYVTFLTNSIIDIDTSTSDMYDVRVPLLKCITPVALVCENAFALSGEDCPFLVKVRNDGNLVATAATFTLYDEDGAVVDEHHVSFATDLLESACNIDADCGYDVENLPSEQQRSKLVVDDGLGVLLPGTVDTFRIAFAIPESWHDKRTVRIGIADVEVIVPEGLHTDALQSYSLDVQECPSATFEVEDTVLDTSSVAAGNVYERTKDGANNDDTSGYGKKTSAKTGDTGVLGIAALALGACGAGFAAYSARRVANEQEEE